MAVIVPEDFSAVVYGSDPAATSQVELYENPTSEIGGSIVEGVVGQVLADFNGARAAAAGAVALRSDAGGDPPRPQVRRPAPPSTFTHAGGVSAGLQISQRSPQAGKTEKEVSVTGSILAGMMIFFMFFGAANVARTILTEDRDGTMPRLFTTPTRHGTIIAGKFVSVFVTVLVQADRAARSPAASSSASTGAASTSSSCSRVVAAGVAGGLALLVISFAKTPAQAGAIGSGVYLVLALLGGNFTGHRADRRHLRASSRSSRPTAGCSTAGTRPCAAAASADIRWQVLVPLGFAVAFFFFAVLKMRRRFA